MAVPKPTTITFAVSPRLLRRREAALYLGISPAMLDALRAQGELRVVPVPAAHHLGEQTRVPLFDIRELDAAVERWKQEKA